MEEYCLLLYANVKGADQTAHMRSVICVFMQTPKKSCRTKHRCEKIFEKDFLYEQEMSQTRDECPQRNWSSIRHI